MAKQLSSAYKLINGITDPSLSTQVAFVTNEANVGLAVLSIAVPSIRLKKFQLNGK